MQILDALLEQRNLTEQETTRAVEVRLSSELASIGEGCFLRTAGLALTRPLGLGYARRRSSGADGSLHGLAQGQGTFTLLD